jgi:3-deoxy-7-phosphoheptulonate synthase
MHNLIDNLRIQAKQTLIDPETLISDFPLSEKMRSSIAAARASIGRIMKEDDKRLLVIVGPCSIHDTQSALEYANLLNNAAQQFHDELFIVMRLYFEKPRTTIGWKGLISDPYLDGSFDMNEGLRISRQLLLQVNELGLPAATEFLDPLIPQYLSDLISWCAIGARTSESQLHRELASALAMPVGFKNSTDGNIQIAIDAVQVAAQSHHFLNINRYGIPTVMQTRGNQDCHIVLRGSNSNINYSEAHVKNAVSNLKNAKLNSRLMIDCSHGNSMKNYELQIAVAENVIQQLIQSRQEIFGIMLESHLTAGKQILNQKNTLTYGQSITDGCMGWQETYSLLEKLAGCVKEKN